MISRWEPQLSVQCLGPQTRRSSWSCRDIPASTSTSKKVLRRICQDLAKSRGNQWKPPRGFFVFSGFSLMKPLGFFSMKPSWGFPYGTIGEHLDATKGLYPFSRETITGFSIEKQVSTVCNTQNEETSGKIIGKNHQQIGFHHEASMKSYELFVMRGYTQKKIRFLFTETTTMKKCLQQKYRVEARAWNWDPDLCGPNNCGWILMLAASLLESPSP